MAVSANSAFCQVLETYFGSGRCFLLAKGRVGLYAGLRALGFQRGTKLLLPGYTCMVVPSAVRFAGLEPRYIDIDPRSYNVDPKQLDLVNARDVSAIVVQHTYGIPCEMSRIMQWAASHGIPVIEDCCHSFGSRYRGQLCGTFGRFAFMSGQWNKPFSTGLGGILLVNDEPLATRISTFLRDNAKSPGTGRSLLLRAQILAFQLMVRPATAMRIMSMYRRINQVGLAIGSSSKDELRGEMPAGYLTAMADCQARQGLREMAVIDGQYAASSIAHVVLSVGTAAYWIFARGGRGHRGNSAAAISGAGCQQARSFSKSALGAR